MHRRECTYMSLSINFCIEDNGSLFGNQEVDKDVCVYVCGTSF